jgi:hypothetical protein
MFIYKEGDKSQGPCETCRKSVTTTFRYAPLKYNDLVIPEVLQDFCDICKSSVSIPHQSSYRIREFRERYNHSLEFRVPPHHTDILVAIGMTHNVTRKPNSLCRIISELYLSKIFKPIGRDIRQKIMEALDDDLSKGKSKDRLSCLFPDATYRALKTISDKEHVTSSAIVKGIIVAAKHDILDNEDKALSKEFETFAASRW